MKKVVLLFIFVLMLAFSNTQIASAQCAMCTISAEQGTKNGNTQGKGLNKGVIYLLSIPYLMIGGLGFVWYRKYRSSRNYD